MNRKAILVAAALAVATTLSAAPAQAQNGRSFVSGHGLDTNACTLAAPCRTFAVAFTHTNAGGEIDVLDTAGYGALIIDKAISIVNDGSVASVLVPSGGVGITVNANPGDAVTLRGLTIEGGGVGLNGIVFNAGQSLTIENCVIRHVTNNGILFAPNVSSNLVVSTTLLADNLSGAFIFPSGSGAVSVVFNRVEADNNTLDGIVAFGSNSTGTVEVTVSDSVSANNEVGYSVTTETGKAATKLVLFHSVATNNQVGLAVDAGAVLRAAQSMVTWNTTAGFQISGGVIQSYGDNYFDGNGSNTGSLTSVTRQ
jgi:Right handed beta helix region